MALKRGKKLGTVVKYLGHMLRVFSQALELQEV